MLGDLKEVLAAVKEAILVAERTQKNTEDIEKIRTELERLVRIVERMADRFDYEIQVIKEREERERENLRLRLENEMLRRESNLPCASPRRKTKELKPNDKAKNTK